MLPIFRTQPGADGQRRGEREPGVAISGGRPHRVRPDVRPRKVTLWRRWVMRRPLRVLGLIGLGGLGGLALLASPGVLGWLCYP